MKKLSNLKIIVALLIGTLFIISCEQSTITTETEQRVEQQEESFKSETGNANNALEISTETTNPVLKMHFDQYVSKEEAILSFNRAADAYINKQSLHNKAFSPEWYFKVWTQTGSDLHNGTDGQVGIYVRFTTSAGVHTTSFISLNNSGDDREGGWDAYLVRASIPGRAIQWVEVDSATLYLEGSDGWLVSCFVIQIAPADQIIPASGFSSLLSCPYIWLDNACDGGCWDYYYTGNIGTGRLYF